MLVEESMYGVEHMTLLQRMEALRREQMPRASADPEIVRIWRRGMHAYDDPAPGPTRHPIVTESDVTWFIWSYAALFFAAGAAVGVAVALMVMR